MKRTFLILAQVAMVVSLVLGLGLLADAARGLAVRYLFPPDLQADWNTTEELLYGYNSRQQIEQAAGLIPVGDPEESYFDWEPFRLWGGFTIEPGASHPFELAMEPYGISDRPWDLRDHLVFTRVTNQGELPDIPAYFDLICVVTPAENIDIKYGRRTVGNYVGSTCVGGVMYTHYFVVKSSYLLEPDKIKIQERFTAMVKAFN